MGWNHELYYSHYFHYKDRLMTIIIHTLAKRYFLLIHWGRVTHICVSKLSIIGSDDGVSPGRPQTIIWTNVGILLIRTLGTNFSEILSEIHTFSFKKMRLKMSSVKLRSCCLGLNVKTYPWRLQRHSKSNSIQLSSVAFWYQQWCLWKRHRCLALSIPQPIWSLWFWHQSLAGARHISLASRATPWAATTSELLRRRAGRVGYPWRT